MSTYKEPHHIGDLLKIEVCPGWTKESGVISKSTVIEIGTVLAKTETAYVLYDPANQKTAPACAIAAETVNASDADMPIVVIARGAVVDPAFMVWPIEATDGQKIAALRGLRTIGIVAKESL